MKPILNYRGVLLSAGQYKVIARNIANKNVIHFTPSTNKDELARELDNFWFRLGYKNSINIVVASHPHDILNKLIYAGLLYDCRDIKLPLSEGGVYDLFHELLYGKATRIDLCNSIRDVLADRKDVRWCGAESESIFQFDLNINATEICGNNPPGQFFSLSEGKKGIIPDARREHSIRNLFYNLISQFDTSGQKKLGSIMCAIPARGHDVIYIGSSPGEAWTRVLSERSFENRVPAIDPEEMADTTNLSFRLIHEKKCIHSVDDIITTCAKHDFNTNKNLIFIWDVRHRDTSRMSTQEKREIIQNEAGVLNSIINSDWFTTHVKMYQIKINTSNVDVYELPSNGKLFIQPFTLDRDVYELRCVGFIDGSDYHQRSLQPKDIHDLNEYINDTKNDVENEQIDAISQLSNKYVS